jgi:hypothetical protein
MIDNIRENAEDILNGQLVMLIRIISLGELLIRFMHNVGEFF